MSSLFEPVTFDHGPPLANRFMVAPLTNQQSHADGTASEEEITWLIKRGEGGFGLTMTCASHVDRLGQGFPGQLGCYSDAHLEGLTRIASGIAAFGSRPHIQLHHAGRRAPSELIGTSPVAPSFDEPTRARALSTEEVEGLIGAFVEAAVRAERAGFCGVELHGAHDYLLCEFLNPEFNQRHDRFGGSLENRYRIIDEILAGISQHCSPDLTVSVRLSPERFGLVTSEMLEVYRWLVANDRVDLIDLSLWDTFKEAVDVDQHGRGLLELFAEIDRGTTRLAVAGQLSGGGALRRALELGADIVAIGRAAITNHDFPRLIESNPDAMMRSLPVPRSVLAAEGVSPAFVSYLTRWPDFVGEE